MDQGSLELERPPNIHPILAISEDVRAKAETGAVPDYIIAWINESDLGTRDSSWPPPNTKRSKRPLENPTPAQTAEHNLYDGIPIVDRYPAPGSGFEGPVPFNQLINLVLNEELPVYKLFATPEMMAKLAGEEGEKASLKEKLDLALAATEPTEASTPEETMCYLRTLMVRGLLHSGWHYGKLEGFNFNQRQIEEIIKEQLGKIASQPSESEKLPEFLKTLSQNTHYWALIQSTILKHLEKNLYGDIDWKQIFKQAQTVLKLRGK